MKKISLVFLALILSFIFVLPVNAQSVLVHSDQGVRFDLPLIETPLPASTLIVLGIIVVLLIVGIFILVSILRSDDKK